MVATVHVATMSGFFMHHEQTINLGEKTSRAFIRAFAYPALLACAALIILVALNWHLSFSVANGIFLGFTIVYLATLERIIPFDKNWHPSKKEWLRDAIYLLITMAGGGFAMAFTLFVASLIRVRMLGWSLWIEVPSALLMSSLGSYIFHRASHFHPWLWRIHGIHHVENKINVGNNGVNHILDVFARRMLAQLPVMVLGISEEALFVVSIFNIVQGYFSHANVDVHLGFFNFLIVGPEQHRLHHSKNLEEAGHYSVDIPFWDTIFGTYHWHSGRIPKEIGVVEPQKFPATDQIWQSFISPFRPRKKITSIRKPDPFQN